MVGSQSRSYRQCVHSGISIDYIGVFLGGHTGPMYIEYCGTGIPVNSTRCEHAAPSEAMERIGMLCMLKLTGVCALLVVYSGSE